MLTRYAERRGFKAEELSSSPNDGGGFKELTFAVKGDGAYSVFKYEGGTHRVQRVPETESQGRIHTSTATVAVMPEAEEVEVEIDANDLKIDVYRSTGPGGQSVNTTDSAVRITHLPTGLVVAMQDEKSQLQNKAEGDARPPRARSTSSERERQQAELAAHPPLADRRRRARREDPHLQLPREPAHRPPDQADRAPARPDPRRASWTSSPRRSPPRTARARARDEAERKADSEAVEVGAGDVVTPKASRRRRSRARARACGVGPPRRRRAARRQRARATAHGALRSTRARALGAEEQAALERCVARRDAREPLAYVLGEWGFRRLTLKVDRRVLVPRPETEVVVERCLELLRGLDRAGGARRRHRLGRDRAGDRRRAPVARVSPRSTSRSVRWRSRARTLEPLS